LSRALGVDLGGTKVEVALIGAAGDGEYTRLAFRRLPTEADDGPEAVVERIAAAAREVLAEAAGPAYPADPAPGPPGRAVRHVYGAGVGVAGQVDGPRGVVRSAPNLPGWEEFPLGPSLSARLGLPVALTNDVNAAALGEQVAGAGRGFDDVVVILVGTGVGGGVVSRGRLVEGAGGYASELGHLTLVAHGRPCTCGNLGCLEAYCGGWAIAERAREVGLETPLDPDVPAARALIEETGRYLGAGLVGIIHAFNPRRVILGGGVIEGLPELVEIATAEIREHTIPVFQEGLEIVPPALGRDAGTLGAAHLARMRFGPRRRLEDEEVAEEERARPA
jgi:glucokinase